MPNFSEYDLVDAVAELSTVWGDSFPRRGSQPKIKTIQALKDREIVDSETFSSPDTKHRKVVVRWLDSDCNTEASVCAAPACDLAEGAVGDSGSATYEIQKCVSHLVQVKNQFTNSNLDRAILIAEQLKKLDVILANKLNKVAIAFIHANIGANLLTYENLEGQAVYDGATKLTTITTDYTKNDPAKWNSQLMGYLNLAAEESLQENPFVLDSSNFALDTIFALQGQQQENFAAKKLMYDMFDFANDVKINAEVAPLKMSYVIDPRSYAIPTENRFTATPTTNYNPQKTSYKVRSKVLPWVEIDITYQQVCVDGVYYDRFLGEIHYDMFNAPDICNTGTTGILGFAKG